MGDAVIVPGMTSDRQCAAGLVAARTGGSITAGNASRLSVAASACGTVAMGADDSMGAASLVEVR